MPWKREPLVGVPPLQTTSKPGVLKVGALDQQHESDLGLVRHADPWRHNTYMSTQTRSLGDSYTH